MPTDEQPYVADRLTRIYDRSLAARYGGDWYAGRNGGHKRNTYDFVRKHHDLLDYYVNARLYTPDETQGLRYDIAATMVERHKRGTGRIAISNFVEQGNYQTEAASCAGLQFEMIRSGDKARVEKKVFSGCGASIKAEGEQDTIDQLEQSGYGNKTEKSDESKYKFDKMMHCVVCQRPPKKDEKPKMCGPCGICRSCDTQSKKNPKR